MSAPLRLSLVALVVLFALALLASAQSNVELLAVEAPVGQNPSNNKFGASVAFESDSLVVGAPSFTQGGVNSGAAFVFLRDTGGSDAFGLEVNLTAADATAGDQIGFSASIEGSNLAVGAPFTDDGGTNRGVVRVYGQNNGGLDKYLIFATVRDPARADNALFGSSVSVSGDILAVGAPHYTNAFSEDGRVLIFQQDVNGTNAWGFVAYVDSPDAGADHHFGQSVSLNSLTLVVGEPNNAASLANGGAAYVFVRNASDDSDWPADVTLQDPSPLAGGLFGSSVAQLRDEIFVSATGKDAVYVYYRDNNGTNQWGIQASLAPSDAVTGVGFGTALAARADRLLIGAPTAGTGGRIYLHERDQSGSDMWGSVEILESSTPVSGSNLGAAVALDGQDIIGGAAEATVSGVTNGLVYVFGPAPPSATTTTTTTSTTTTSGDNSPAGALALSPLALLF